jgi:uncharacterized protein
MPLLSQLHQLEKRPLVLRGELSPGELDLAEIDPLIRVNQPMRYDLQVELLGRNLLIKGALRLELECQCVRCLKKFACEVALADWVCHLPLEGEERVAVSNDCVDLTPFVREDILLAFPQHPLCEPECGGLPYQSKYMVQKNGGAHSTGELSSTWATLNKLKL